MNMDARTLDQWLAYVETVHPVGIDLGLERVGAVAERMGFEPPGHRPAPRSVIVAGTNGKGSTCMVLEALLSEAGLRTGTTLSPHLHVFNERVRIDGQPADDDTLCAAFARVENARGDIPLTYFEFSALVALECFRGAGVDVAVLEVGLGGRLDAFNLVTADVSVITSIGLEHQAFLGGDLESIGREKAGVMREGRPVILGADVPGSVVARARELGCPQSRLGVDFHVVEETAAWTFQSGGRRITGLPRAGLAPANCALALEAAACLMEIPQSRVKDALGAACLPGRLEAWQVGEGPDARLLVLDVAHNPAAARFLADELARRYPRKRFVAVLGTLADKDSAGVAAALEARVRAWVCGSTRGPRGLSAAELAGRVGSGSGSARARIAVSDLPQGLQRALSLCNARDGILTCGSFDIVEQMRRVLMAGHIHAVPMDRSF